MPNKILEKVKIPLVMVDEAVKGGAGEWKSHKVTIKKSDRLKKIK